MNGIKRQFVSEGHLVDSGILTRILNLIVEEGASYEINKFIMGKNNLESSHIELTVTCTDNIKIDSITAKLVNLGCYEKVFKEAILKPAPKDSTVPEDFYSTTNHKTLVFLNGTWHEVQKQRMDGVIVAYDGAMMCKKLRDVKKGEKIVCTSQSVRLIPPFRDRESGEFGFMVNDVSSERSVDVAVEKIAEEFRRVRKGGGKIIAVAGPVVIHTGGGMALASMIREGYINGLLTGNALAVHDIESVFFGTSLGVDLKTGRPTYEGHRNHMRAINRIFFHGSIKKAIDAGILNSGVMYEVIKKNIPFVLAGSLRDDGPLPETITNNVEAQEQYQKVIQDASIVIMLSTMLHSIATGNMLPSWVKTICVDINPAVVTKLADRGSAQTIGIVTDVGLFMRLLAQKLLG
ncbi:MAG: TIGR00300 family protein [Spirochaetales bacterium]|nr:TIGR00300 family protein [Spirochaetales bacterium]